MYTEKTSLSILVKIISHCIYFALKSKLCDAAQLTKFALSFVNGVTKRPIDLWRGLTTYTDLALKSLLFVGVRSR